MVYLPCFTVLPHKVPIICKGKMSKFPGGILAGTAQTQSSKWTPAIIRLIVTLHHLTVGWGGGGESLPSILPKRHSLHLTMLNLQHPHRRTLYRKAGLEPSKPSGS